MMKDTIVGLHKSWTQELLLEMISSYRSASDQELYTQTLSFKGLGNVGRIVSVSGSSSEKNYNTSK